MSVSCIQCGSKLKVVINGGEFFIREGSTLEDLNFEKVKKIDFKKAEEINEDVMLQVHIECSKDPSHMIFAYTDSTIRQEIYRKIELGARRLRIQNM